MKRQPAAKRASFYEPLEASVLMCYEPHGGSIAVPVAADESGADGPAGFSARCRQRHGRRREPLEGAGCRRSSGPTAASRQFHRDLRRQRGRGARAVVDQAIADWNKIILNFNHAGGGNTYNITFTVADLSDTVAEGSYDQ